jgi:hypothetical protein
MKHRYRLLVALLIALIGYDRLPAARSDGAPWQTGDLFAGVGRANVLRGEYMVFSASGDWKETLENRFAGRTTTTTGCVAAPRIAGGALYATGFASLAVTRFDAAPPHEPRTVATVDYPGVEAVESIVFDPAGNYYLGTLPPARKSALDPIPPSAYILKYSPANALLAAYEVPTGVRGANWIDLGSDQQTLYYTSEDTTIHVYRPGVWPIYREMVITDGGAPIGGTVYAIRALPPLPGDPSTPSGFIAASSKGLLRLDWAARVRLRYNAPVAGDVSTFAVNITPDGQSVWTATFHDNIRGSDKRSAGAGELVRFHIPTGAVTAGPISTGAPNVWGLCVQDEYNAAANVCVDGSGAAVSCRIPEYCDNGADDDGDGLGDAADSDCVAPRLDDRSSR